MRFALLFASLASVLFASEAARADEVIGAPPSTSTSTSTSTPTSTSTSPPTSTSTPTSTVQAEAHAAAGGPVVTTADGETPVGPEGRRRWYGWQTLITDGAGFALMIAGGSSNSGATAGVGLATYAFGGPIVHFAHANVGRGFASLGIRGGAPVLVGLGTMAAFSSKRDGWDQLGYFAIGFVVGMFGAVAVDAAVLARDHVEPEEPPKSARLRVRVAPSLAPIRGGAMGGLQGAF